MCVCTYVYLHILNTRSNGSASLIELYHTEIQKKRKKIKGDKENSKPELNLRMSKTRKEFLKFLEKMKRSSMITRIRLGIR